MYGDPGVGETEKKTRSGPEEGRKQINCISDKNPSVHAGVRKIKLALRARAQCIHRGIFVFESLKHSDIVETILKLHTVYILCETKIEISVFRERVVEDTDRFPEVFVGYADDDIDLI